MIINGKEKMADNWMKYNNICKKIKVPLKTQALLALLALSVLNPS